MIRVFSGNSRMEVITAIARCRGDQPDFIIDALKLYITTKQQKGRNSAQIVSKLEGLENSFKWDSALHELFHQARADTGLPRSKILPPSRRLPDSSTSPHSPTSPGPEPNPPTSASSGPPTPPLTQTKLRHSQVEADQADAIYSDTVSQYKISRTVRSRGHSRERGAISEGEFSASASENEDSWDWRIRHQTVGINVAAAVEGSADGTIAMSFEQRTLRIRQAAALRSYRSIRRYPTRSKMASMTLNPQFGETPVHRDELHAAVTPSRSYRRPPGDTGIRSSSPIPPSIGEEVQGSDSDDVNQWELFSMLDQQVEVVMPPIASHALPGPVCTCPVVSS